MKILKKLFLPLVGFVIGCIFFFPWNDVKDLLTGMVMKNSGISLSMQSFEPTTGLRLGVSKGSLFAFSGTKAVVRLPSGQVLMCDEIIVAPRFWPILIGQAQVGIACKSHDGGELIALAHASPIWSPSKASVSIEMSAFSLKNIDLNMAVEGIFTGSVEVTDIAIPANNASLPSVTWDISASDVHSPALSGMFSLPALDLGDTKSEGSFSARGIKVPTFEFGSSQGSIEGKLDVDTDYSMADRIPKNGSIAGNLRLSPDMEVTMSKYVNLTILFGEPDSKGVRKFKRNFKNGINSLLMQKYTGEAE